MRINYELYNKLNPKKKTSIKTQLINKLLEQFGENTFTRGDILRALRVGGTIMYTVQNIKTGEFYKGWLEYTGRGTPILYINSITSNPWEAIKFSKKSNVLRSFKRELKTETLKIVKLEMNVVN